MEVVDLLLYVIAYHGELKTDLFYVHLMCHNIKMHLPFLNLFTHWAFKVCFDQWPRDNTMVERSPPSGIIHSWARLNDVKWLWRKFSWKEKKTEQQKPSQCKCLLPFLTGTLSHQLQHKIKTWLPKWSVAICSKHLKRCLEFWNRTSWWKDLTETSGMKRNWGNFRLGQVRKPALKALRSD